MVSARLGCGQAWTTPGTVGPHGPQRCPVVFPHRYGVRTAPRSSSTGTATSRAGTAVFRTGTATSRSRYGGSPRHGPLSHRHASFLTGLTSARGLLQRHDERTAASLSSTTSSQRHSSLAGRTHGGCSYSATAAPARHTPAARPTLDECVQGTAYGRWSADRPQRTVRRQDHCGGTVRRPDRPREGKAGRPAAQSLVAAGRGLAGHLLAYIQLVSPRTADRPAVVGGT